MHIVSVSSVQHIHTTACILGIGRSTTGAFCFYAQWYFTQKEKKEQQRWICNWNWTTTRKRSNIFFAFSSEEERRNRHENGRTVLNAPYAWWLSYHGYEKTHSFLLCSVFLFISTFRLPICWFVSDQSIEVVGFDARSFFLSSSPLFHATQMYVAYCTLSARCRNLK